VCWSVQGRGESPKSPGIRDQYPRDIVKPAGPKNDVNSMRSVEHKKCNIWCIENDLKFALFYLKEGPFWQFIGEEFG